MECPNSGSAAPMALTPRMIAVAMPPRSRASTRSPQPRRDEGAQADQAPERALRGSTAAGVTHIGDHEGHVGDVSGAEQEIAGEIDQHRPDRELDRRGVGNPGAAVERRHQQRNDHDRGEQRHRPPDHPPRSRPERLQHKRRDQAGRHDAEPGSGVKQAQQEVRPLGPRLRDGRRQRSAADKGDRRADAHQQPCEAQDREIARQRGQRQRRHAGQGRPAHRGGQPETLDQLRGDQRAAEIAGGVDRVHEARGGIRPAERIAHVRQHQRIGEASDAEADNRRQRQDQDQPRGMRGR